MTAGVVDRVDFSVDFCQENFSRPCFRGRHATFGNILASYRLLWRFLTHHPLDIFAQALSLGGKSHEVLPLILQTIVGKLGDFLLGILEHVRLHRFLSSKLTAFNHSTWTKFRFACDSSSRDD